MINCIAIDDQDVAIKVMVEHISKIPQLNLLKTYTDPIEALSFLETNRIDLVFLDIQMPHIGGLDFIESLRSKQGNLMPEFILTTGHNQYALSGFEQGVADYLLKPIGFKRFKIAIDRLISKKLQSVLSEFPKEDFFFADLNGKKQKINFKEISFIESAGNYVSVFGDNDLKAVIYNSMNGMQEIVPKDNFMRVHKSYIVSINHIHAIKGNAIIVKRNGAEINVPMGSTFRMATLKKLRIKG